MDESIVQGPVGMPRGSSLRIDDGSGLLLRVQEGMIWLTQDGCPKDHVLLPGERFRLDRNGTALVYAFHRSTLTLMAPASTRFACRVALLRTGGRPAVGLYDAQRRMPARARLAWLLRRLWKQLSLPQVLASRFSLTRWG